MVLSVFLISNCLPHKERAHTHRMPANASRPVFLNSRAFFTTVRPSPRLLQHARWIPAGVRRVANQAATLSSKAPSPAVTLAALTASGVLLGSLVYPKSDDDLIGHRMQAPQNGFSMMRNGESGVADRIYPLRENELVEMEKLPREVAHLTTAPKVPPPITRDYQVLIHVPLTTMVKVGQLTNQFKYEKWCFNGTTPGPFIRARVGDVVELALTNKDETGNPHNIDCHAFTGPGGGAALTTAEENETKVGRFRLLHPGLYIYHCAAAPVPVHIANGMYGLLYVQAEKDTLPTVDKEYYVMQSEFYHEPPEVDEEDGGRLSSQVEFSYPNAMREDPQVVVFNGSESAMTRDNPLKANVGDTVRVFFGNAGPNLTSSFHIIGSIFQRVWRDGSVIVDPGLSVDTTAVPPGGSTIVDMTMSVPGTYAIVDHAIFRMDRGGVGFLNVSGKNNDELYQSHEPASPCVGCKLHP